MARQFDGSKHPVPHVPPTIPKGKGYQMDGSKHPKPDPHPPLPIGPGWSDIPVDKGVATVQGMNSSPFALKRDQIRGSAGSFQNPEPKGGAGTVTTRTGKRQTPQAS
jgi:hypothetical protein